jgi:hypothetical protein
MIGAGHQLMTVDDFMVGKDDPIMVLLVSLKTNKTIFFPRLTLIFMIISRLDQALNDLHASSGHNRNERQVRRRKKKVMMTIMMTTD